jgi:hypothetical protein
MRSKHCVTEGQYNCFRSCEYAAPCYPIEVPPNDPRITNRRCIDFFRSSAICGSGQTSVFFDTLMPREQINQLTSYIDASQVSILWGVLTRILLSSTVTYLSFLEISVLYSQHNFFSCYRPQKFALHLEYSCLHCQHQSI